MSRHRFPLSLGPIAALLLAIPLLATPQPAEAQDSSITWTETREFEVPGVFGAFLARRAGGADRMDSPRGIHLFGNTLRQDDGASSVIMDLDESHYLIVEHEARTFMVLEFGEALEAIREMEALMSELQEDHQDAMEEARREYEEAMAEEELEVEFTFHLESEPTGETRDFDGILAERYFLTGRLEMEAAVDGVDEVERGTLLFLVELWQSDEVPSVEEILEVWGEKVAQDPEMQALARELTASLEYEGDEAGMEAAALWDPRIAAGLQEIVEAIESLEGTTIRSTTTVAVVPDGAPYDRDDLLAWEPTTMGSVVRRAAADAAQEAGRDAARRAVRGATRGILGRGGRDEPEPEEEPQVQALFRMISVKSGLQVGIPDGPLTPDLQGYREIRLADLMGELPEPGGPGEP